jgi:hypothetical protein
MLKRKEAEGRFEAAQEELDSHEEVQNGLELLLEATSEEDKALARELIAEAEAMYPDLVQQREEAEREIEKAFEREGGIVSDYYALIRSADAALKESVSLNKEAAQEAKRVVDVDPESMARAEDTVADLVARSQHKLSDEMLAIAKAQAARLFEGGEDDDDKVFDVVRARIDATHAGTYRDRRLAPSGHIWADGR